jgi:hypothetical protein
MTPSNYFIQAWIDQVEIIHGRVIIKRNYK